MLLVRHPLICIFCLDVCVDDDIKAQIAALMKMQKELDADRARSSILKSAGSTQCAYGKKKTDELYQVIDKQVSGK